MSDKNCIDLDEIVADILKYFECTPDERIEGEHIKSMIQYHFVKNYSPENELNLYLVRSEIEGLSPVCCMVLAETMARSLELARCIFKAENPEFPDYYNNLQSEIVFRGCSKEQVSDISGEQEFCFMAKKEVQPKCCLCRWCMKDIFYLVFGLNIGVRCGAQAYQLVTDAFGTELCKEVYEPKEDE